MKNFDPICLEKLLSCEDVQRGQVSFDISSPRKLPLSLERSTEYRDGGDEAGRLLPTGCTPAYVGLSYSCKE